jgi:hypothetical protein
MQPLLEEDTARARGKKTVILALLPEMLLFLG